MENQSKAFVLAGITVLCWSTVSTAFKIALAVLSPLELITISMVFSALFLGVYIVCTKEYPTMLSLTKAQKLYGLVPGVILFVYYMLLFMAYDVLPAQIALSVNYTWSVMLALLGAWLLKQKLSMAEFGWLLVAYLGVVVISVGSLGHFGNLDAFGLICIILSTFLYAVYWIGCTKSAFTTANQLFVSFVVCALCGVIVLILRGTALPLTAQSLYPALYIALFELSIPFICWGYAIRFSSSVSKIATIPFLSPVLALFWVNLILKEHIAPTTYLGLALIVVGAFMQQRSKGAPLETPS